MYENLDRFPNIIGNDSYHIVNTYHNVSQASYFYLQEAGRYQCTYPFVSERNPLNSYLILCTLSGRGLLTYHGMTYQIEPNHCFFIPCTEHHRFQAALHEKWDFYFLYFNGANVEQYYSQYHQDPYQVLILENGAAFGHTMQEIADLYQKRNPLSDTLINYHITDLLTKLLVIQSEKHAPCLAFPDYLKRIIQYMELHYAEPLTLDSLAVIENISKFSLSREFKHYIGISPNEYLISLRMAHAKELLQYTTTPISEIALSCGVTNVSHFINLFKARENRTPLRFRKEWNSAVHRRSSYLT